MSITANVSPKLQRQNPTRSNTVLDPNSTYRNSSIQSSNNHQLGNRVRTFFKRPDIDALLESTDANKLLREAIDKYERAFHKRHLFTASFTQYCNKETPSLRRQCIVQFFFLLYIICTLRFWATVFIKKTDYWVALGDCLYLTKDRIAYNFCIACCFSTGVLGRWYWYKAEKERKLYFLYTMKRLRNGEDKMLNPVSLKRFARKFQTYTKLFLLFGPLSCCFPTGLSFTIYAGMATYFKEYPFHWIPLMLTTMGFYYGAYCTAFCLVVGITFMEQNLAYCCWCYKQCQERVRESVKNSRILPKDIFVEYANLAIQVYKMNEAFRLYIGGMYCFFTPTIDSLIYMAFFSRAHLWVRISVFIVLILASFVLIGANYLPAKLNSVAKRGLKDLHGYCVRSGVGLYRQLSLAKRWDLVCLMESLAKSNIGIWIGSYVLITKKVFFHYILSLMGLFMLLLNFNRKMKRVRRADAALIEQMERRSKLYIQNSYSNPFAPTPEPSTLILSTETALLDTVSLIAQWLPTDVID